MASSLCGVWEFTSLTTPTSPVTDTFAESHPPGFSLCHGWCRPQGAALRGHTKDFSELSPPH